MKKALFSGMLLFATVLFSGNIIAQIKTPQPSPTAELKQTVGLAEIEVSYSRPGLKGREVFGSLIPYGKIWRTGANASTKISFSDDVHLAGNKVPKGKYALYTIPNENSWTIIIHKNLELWGAGNYAESDDLLRFEVKPQTLQEKVESFTIDFSQFKSGGANLNLKWEKTLVAIPIEVDTDTKVMAQIKSQIIDSKEVDTKLYAPAANYYLAEGKDLNLALNWIDKAIESQPKAFWLVHSKAKILAGLGKNKEAIKVAEQSKELAKNDPRGDFGYIKNNDTLIAKIKSKK